MQFPRYEAPNSAECGPVTFASKGLTSVKIWYSNIEWEVLGILHGLKILSLLFCPWSQLDNKPKTLVAIFKKEVVSLTQRLQWIILHINQYNIRILYKHWPQLFIMEQVSRYNHETNKNEEILGLNITINAIDSCMDIPDCMTTKKNYISDHRWWAPNHIVILCIAQLAINERWSMVRSTVILVSQGWNCDN